MNDRIPEPCLFSEDLEDLTPELMRGINLECLPRHFCQNALSAFAPGHKLEFSELDSLSRETLTLRVKPCMLLRPSTIR